MSDASSKFNVDVKDSAGFVVGDDNTIYMTFTRQDGKLRKIPLLPVEQLKLESFKMGDVRAATFPYVTTPIQAVYAQTMQVLSEVSDTTRRVKQGIVIFGESNSGKTRLALEALKATLSAWLLLSWRPDYTGDDIPPIDLLKERNLILFLDDLQEYIIDPLQVANTRLLSTSSSIVTVRTLTETLLQTSNVIILATSRSENREQVQAFFDFLLTKLTEISLPSFTPNPLDPLAQQTIAAFQKKGDIFVKEWDGTLGSLVLGLSAKNAWYLALVQSNNPATIILCAMKLLKLASTKVYTERLLRGVCADVFAQKKLQESDQVWRDAVGLLTQVQFLTEELDENSGQKALVIRKDTYFEQVITDYPPINQPHQIEEDFLQLRNVLVELKEKQALPLLGVTFAQQGRYEEAIATFDLVLAFDPNIVDAWLGKGTVLAMINDDSEAIVAFDHMLTLDPDNVRSYHALVLKGISLSTLGRNEEALVALNRALAFDHYQIDAWVLKSTILAQLNQYDEALVALNHALTIDPTNAEAWYRKGTILVVLTKRDAEAVTAFEQALAINPTNATAWYLKGTSLRALMQHEEAIVAFDHTLALDPTNAGAWYLKGASLFTLNRYKEATVALNHALTLDPTNTDTWLKQGGALYALGRYEEAIETFDHFLALMPNDVNAWALKSISLNLMERHEEAVVAFDHTLALDPTNAGLWLLKGQSLRSLGRDEEAIVAFDNALACDSNNASAWRDKGLSLAVLGRHEEALAALDRALAINPGDAEAWYRKGAINAVMGRVEEVLIALDRALAFNPSNSGAYLLKGVALKELRRYEEAIVAFDQVLILTPNDSEAWQFKADTLRLLGREKEAQEVEAQASKLNG
ncbi:MAG: tetratricopeptide repeat protein [Ktedonobacteraceae bacterium]